MGRFTTIPQSTFDDLQLDAGVLLKTFDPSTGAAPDDEDIICATTGGINVACVPTYSNLGEDIDNVIGEYKELKHLDSWACTMAFTGLGTSPEMIRLALGAADLEGATYSLTTDTAVNSSKTYYTRSGTAGNYTYTEVTSPTTSNLASYYEMTSPDSTINPRRNLSQSDFSDLWWVGDKADGGFVAVQLKNALSTAGLTLQTTKNGKGQVSVTLTGHMSISDQETIPMVFYSTSA